MLPKRAFIISGISFLFIGLIFLSSGASQLTGLAIIEDSANLTDYQFGVWFILAGLVSFLFGRSLDSQS